VALALPVLDIVLVEEHDVVVLYASAVLYTSAELAAFAVLHAFVTVTAAAAVPESVVYSQQLVSSALYILQESWVPVKNSAIPPDVAIFVVCALCSAYRSQIDSACADHRIVDHWSYGDLFHSSPSHRRFDPI